MKKILALAALCVAACASALAADHEQRASALQSVNRSLEVLNMISTATKGSQDGAMRRCRSWRDEANSADKLGSKEMAQKNWERAARGCKADAVSACRAQRASAPKEECHSLSGLYPG